LAFTKFKRSVSYYFYYLLSSSLEGMSLPLNSSTSIAWANFLPILLAIQQLGDLGLYAIGTRGPIYGFPMIYEKSKKNGFK
jgi:hypothetical protein